DPHVEVFSGRTGALIRSFEAFPFPVSGGVTVAGGDVNGDGRADIIAGVASNGPPAVFVYSGPDQTILRAFFGFRPTFLGRVLLATGDGKGGGRADIIVGAGNGGPPQTVVFDGATQGMMASFYVHNLFDPTRLGQVPRESGLRVAVLDVFGD